MPKTTSPAGHAIHAPCKQRIVWATTATMDKVPLDWPPTTAGTLVAEVTAPGGFTGCRPYVPGELLLHPLKRFGDHRETCPKRESTADQVWWTSEEPELAPGWADEVRAEQSRQARDRRNKRGRRPGKPITGIRWRPRS